ncbi:MAG: L,D-transpeptidase [Verrucomicrobiaceae bacterium]|nr:L,D-transpeptidase [Verrucomicrobiaceae bacterium]
MKAIRLTLSLAAALLLSQCAMPVSMPSLFSSRHEVIRRPLIVQPAQASSPPLFVWHGAGSPGVTSVNIDLSEQKAFIYKNSQNVGWTYVATGRSGFSTPTGTFRILEKQVDKRSNRYGSIVSRNGDVLRSNATAGVHSARGGHFVGAKMPYWMRLTGYGIGMHAGPIPNPGSPASHGCIRLPYDMAQTIYQNAPVGTRVTIMR